MRKTKMILVFASILAGLMTVGCTTSRSGEAGESNSVIKPAPVKILVRRRDNGILAVDGVILQIKLLSAALEYQPLSDIELASDDMMAVEQETTSEMRSPADEKVVLAAPSPWTRDPSTFDFVVSWTVNSVERRKSSLGGDLEIVVTEQWALEAPSNPSLKKNWKCEYMLHVSNTSSSNERAQQAAVNLTRSVIAPARAPIIREIRSMVIASQDNAAAR